jgi:NAD(P)-dependent dehydrogenase (short-subunit alcohol dehydrogenase family)
MQPLKGKIAVVAGATRGAGRGIACMLGEAGATVYCSGRSIRGSVATTGPFAGRPETIEETAEMVNARGGLGIPVQVDHNIEDQVKGLFERVKAEQERLDLLVNNFWGGPMLDPWTEFGKPFWEIPLEKGRLLEQHIHSHLLTSRYAAPLMIDRDGGLIIEIIDGDNLGYRGHFFYDLVITSIIRIVYSMAEDLYKHNVTALAVTPGYMRTEAILDKMGVTEENWREGGKKDPNFLASETPFFVGRAIAAIAADPRVQEKSGGIYSSWGLAREYGFTDVDGSRPDIGKHFEEQYNGHPGGLPKTGVQWTLSRLSG